MQLRSIGLFDSIERLLHLFGQLLLLLQPVKFLVHSAVVRLLHFDVFSLFDGLFEVIGFGDLFETFKFHGIADRLLRFIVTI